MDSKQVYSTDKSVKLVFLVMGMLFEKKCVISVVTIQTTLGYV
jgi:hypothetical protein